MSEEILINITPMESRVAVVENGVLQEVHVERTQRRGIVGNIYKGRVVRVLPGMQAAFVDIGLERAAFIHAAEISNREGSAVESISALVHEGQALVVQVTKDPIGTKGARLTTHLSIPSRYLVYMPRTSHVGISLRIEKIRIDSRENFQKITSFVEELMPEISDRLEHYPGERPIFDLYGVEDEIQKALERKVLLKSGGYLIVDPTEAMTTIDVNTGAFVGHRNLEETIFKTNLEAATAIARQLRLRNLGGIIIIDFIDMEDEEHRRQVLRTLEKQLERDHAKTNIIGITELGLVQMTRKRTRESLVQILCEPCPCCQGRGMLKTAETTCYEIFREILREARAYQADSYLVLANQKVVDRLLDEESGNVADLEAFIGRTIKFQVEAMYSQEQYDVVLL
ncbi:Rne/Rng family ribonuclease [Pseudomonas aeruginosa]|uniref:Rne/Rng family ribonuclease n=1 Tax=Pseudomonas aeruginosa TaxID=287 RepID=UPI00093A2F60|nr:ribonuclease E/G [Pseudomonas aeruginosa]